MATVQLSTKNVGDVIKVKEGSSLVNFLIVDKTVYGGVCLLRQDIHSYQVWNANNINTYSGSDIDKWLTETYFNSIDETIRNQIMSVSIKYTPGNGNSTVGTLSRKVFLLSGTEVGFSYSYMNTEGTKLAYFTSGNGSDSKRVAKYNGSAGWWWLRSPSTSNTSYAWNVYADGSYYDSNVYHTNYGARPAFVLPSSLWVSDDGSVTATPPNTAPQAPASITVPDPFYSATAATITWPVSTDAEGNLSGYVLERKLNNSGDFTQVYKGATNSYSDTVADGTTAVQYRVKAYDAANAESGYTTSELRTVTKKNVAPTAPATITVPNPFYSAVAQTISWAASSDTDGKVAGYILERNLNDSGTWSQVYKNTATSFADTVAAGSTYVQYRVKAYDDKAAESPYTTGTKQAVTNNTAPAITSSAGANAADLGTKAAEFTVPYVVDDAQADKVTVTEYIDAIQLKQHTPTLKADNTLSIPAATWQKLTNGKHTIKITASDTKATTTFTLTFTKKVTTAVITLKNPIVVEEQITLATMSINGSIPADAVLKVEVTNNAKDGAPVWQDVSQALHQKANIVFTNKTQTGGWAFNFRITVSEGTSGTGGYISSIQGAFQ